MYGKKTFAEHFFSEMLQENHVVFWHCAVFSLIEGTFQE